MPSSKRLILKNRFKRTKSLQVKPLFAAKRKLIHVFEKLQTLFWTILSVLKHTLIYAFEKLQAIFWAILFVLKHTLICVFEKVKTLFWTILFVFGRTLISAGEKLKTIFWSITQKLMCTFNPNKKYPKIECDSYLTMEQKQALMYVSNKAKHESQKVLDENGTLTLRAKKLKISESDLLKTLEYIKDKIPLVIHVHVAVLELLVNDTHYRNQFETNRSGGKLCAFSRKSWENNMFNNIYDNVIPFDRCKYGCINTNNNYRAVRSAYLYGDNYFVLKHHMRSRTTCWYFDSADFNRNDSLGTLEHYAHIFVKFSDWEIMNIVSMAVGSAAYTKNYNGNYKEVQFHGPISLDHDIKTLVINKKYKVNESVNKIVNTFKSRGIEVLYSDK